MKGFLAIILHTHLPYVRHAEDPHALEQRWLFEAMTESYIPLLNVFAKLCQDDVRFRLTMSITPPLLDLLGDPLVQERYLRYLDRTVELAEKEVTRLRHDRAFGRVAEMYLWKLREARWVYLEKYQGSLLNGFRALTDAGCLELITSAATHAYLPLLRSREAVAAQIDLGIEAYRSVFGRLPRGLWLPECGFTPEIDEVVAERGIQFVVVDSHAVLHADPAPDTAVYAPVRTRAGTLAFARDPESAKQVWSGKEGYPGDYVYREYYRDIGWDLDFDYIKPYIHPDGIRVNTGLKYYRITGAGAHREPYVPEWAENRVISHAEHFLWAREEQIHALTEKIGCTPCIVSPYDTELYGHWWYEGPAFLNYLIRKACFDQDNIALISPIDYPHPPAVADAELPGSSWGNEGYHQVWLNPSNAWVYRHLHAAEERMTALAEARLQPASSLEQRALNQACRELMLAQSSDWAFILNAGTATAYANRRLAEHLGWFFALCSQIEKSQIDEGFLTELERRHRLFSFLDYHAFASPDAEAAGDPGDRAGLRIMMISWEFPPITVGGLGRHVYELSKALALAGVKVHVVTLGGRGLPKRQIVNGVTVHRTGAHSMPGDSFLDWVFQLNLQLYELARQIWMRWPCDVVHGHDWLVGEAARMIARRHDAPLLATIHATEHGRNNGLHNETQRSIDSREREFMAAADRVIICSRAMHGEMTGIFGLPPEKAVVIPNGVDIASLVPAPGPALVQLPPTGRLVAFVGRLVKEKGPELLVEAAGEVCRRHPDVSFVLAGRGPLLDQLKQRIGELGLPDRVLFPGFVDDRGRNAILARAAVAVFPSLYEPFGIVALEAMGAGVPTIVSDIGGLAEIVEHGVDGWKVYPGDLAGIVDAIDNALENPYAATVAAQGREKVARVYGWTPVAEKTMEVYNGLTQSDKRQSMALAVNR